MEPRGARRTKAADPFPSLREHDELRHSFRSVVQHFRPHVRKLHLVTGDLPVPDILHARVAAQTAGLNDESSPCPDARKQMVPRIGQVPSWLNTNKYDGDIRVDITHHSQYFAQYNDTIFNSLAIESQLPNLPDLHEHL